ncbi:MAG: hypothetical protein JRG86_14155 [Deltaproteobacteria bacterium]|jgi:hypothetical protein|nr:hypothetical protein [Deltaproteobacteria bacterium]MBW2500517.1 hypothetical protein [Deltaproteobacteria bacterium]
MELESGKNKPIQRHPTTMQPPRVNPVGLVETPADFRTRPRSHRAGTRVAAALILVAFTIVVVVTSAATLGEYCLTSQAGAPLPISR